MNPSQIPARPIAEATEPGVEALGRLVWEAGWRRVAVVGASKNAGKTTALNALTTAASRRGERVGLVSIGVDGEAFDAWLDIAKPRVRVEKGTLVVTAASSAAEAGNLLKVLRELDFGSALGPAVLAEARGPGGVQLCGVPHRGHVIAAVEQLQHAGAQRVLIDGAYHRQAAAQADVADAVVLAIGAVLGDSAQQAADRATPSLQALATLGLETAGAGWLGSQLLECPGALTERWLLLQDLSQVRAVIVEGPSRVLCGLHVHQQLARRGIALLARRPVPLCAVTTNPYRPGGADDAPDVLQAAVVDVLARLGIAAPVVDVVRGLIREVA